MIFCHFLACLYGQKDSLSFIDFSAYVELDSVMIIASKKGFSVEEFIKIIQNDNSLETSFNNLRKTSYRYSNDIQYYGNDNSLLTAYASTNRQVYTGECQYMEVENERVSEKYFKRSGEYKFYTSRFYDRVFYKPINTCNSDSDKPPPSRSKRIFERRTNELKKFIYTPGSEVDVPLIGKKTAIFSDRMIEHYNFSLSAGTAINGLETYCFRAMIKPGFNNDQPNGSVIKFLEIIMTKESKQVLSRKYKLQYDSGIYSFDILITVDLRSYKGEYIPTNISYRGYWKVLGKKKENCKFHFKIIEFL